MDSLFDIHVSKIMGGVYTMNFTFATENLGIRQA